MPKQRWQSSYNWFTGLCMSLPRFSGHWASNQPHPAVDSTRPPRCCGTLPRTVSMLYMGNVNRVCTRSERVESSQFALSWFTHARPGEPTPMVTRHGHNHLMCHPKSKNVCTHPAGELLDVLTVVGWAEPAFSLWQRSSRNPTSAFKFLATPCVDSEFEYTRNSIKGQWGKEGFICWLISVTKHFWHIVEDMCVRTITRRVEKTQQRSIAIHWTSLSSLNQAAPQLLMRWRSPLA